MEYRHTTSLNKNKQHENPLSGLVIDLTCLNQKTESGCREVIQNQLPG
jgi:hypothetical protein